MITPVYTNDNPTPIRRKRTTNYIVGGPVFSGNEGYDSAEGEQQALADEALAKEQKKQQRIETVGNAFQALPFALDAVASFSKQIDQQARMRDAIMKQNRQKPIWDYNAMYGDNQPLIKAVEGAMVRSTTDGSAPFKIDNGEFLIMPDGKLEKAQGSSKKTDDISTILPEGTKILSNTLFPKTFTDPKTNELKPNKSKKTYAELASKHDYSDELTTLENPYSKPVSKTSAERMLQRKQKALNALFDEQQAHNGNSSGEMMESQEDQSEHKSGGWIKGAVNPAHKGYCTPMTKSTCTGHRRAFALTMKKHHGFHHEMGGYADGGMYEDGGEIAYARGGDIFSTAFGLQNPISPNPCNTPSFNPIDNTRGTIGDSGIYNQKTLGQYTKAPDLYALPEPNYTPNTPPRDFTKRNTPKMQLDANGRMFNMGGTSCGKGCNIGYELGGSYDLTPQEIKRLKKMGYQIENM